MIDVTDTINAGAAAGPLVLLALVILLGIIAMIVIAWRALPLLELLANKIPQAIHALKEETATNNQTAKANGGAVADLTESVSQFMAGASKTQEKHEENQVQLSASQEKLGEHFLQSVDVLSKISNRLGTQSTQMDALLGDSTVTRDTVAKTATSVGEIKVSISQGVEQLGKITHLLEELKSYNDNHHCIQQTDIEKLIDAWSTAKQDILDAVKGIFEPAKFTAPPDTVAFEVEVEKKEGVQS